MLTAIMGYTGLALDGVSGDQPLYQDLLNIQAAARRAAALTQQLLAFTRRQTAHPAIINLNDLTRELYSMLRHLITEAIDLHLVLAPELGLVYIDPHQFEQVIINLVLNAQSDPKQASSAPDTLPTGTETILVVEDEKAVLDLTARVLRRLGYGAIEARHGLEAADLALNSDTPIDLLITDVIMPKMNSGALATALKAKLPHLKVLFVSGYTATALKGETMTDLHRLLLPKPFTPFKLARKVREVLDS